ncbi:sll0447 [Synechocystis sp. PCC 6803]|uniref:Sll0447 protein n=2 Tax=Synechocystis TaxID=1142 RepID=P74681_SYNY3|nr:hypothetical protein [Synechocystis sp. PCC 6803]AVP91085.1 hypothetical protein C7I86_16245 [Synechocystis sp. IPPAS B-1465]MBD2618214.1 hypothetical protein [Synechocystis sp. FACHB-898]MBD2637499.1 hypothetical protein [Synechocystis sp. FACHB-908]MBD2660708.1 hypothetical protein [Synechocystis sp. FACHB-929]BAL34008.1 hypothetical protein SYNPCCN_3091 [Synechocystis sp. PCC 6803 substr. PCC-N]BAL37177.1 hypothetical protein SYNPCCP_3091 [Synechocystis sp. PCC 6803 substr. PCC-P]
MEFFKLISEQSWISISITASILAFIFSMVSIAISILNNKKMRGFSSDFRKVKKISETVETQGKKILLNTSDINQVQQQLNVLSNQIQKYKEKNITLHTKVADLSSQLNYLNSVNRYHDNRPKSFNVNELQVGEIEQQKEQIDQVKIILEQYAQLNVDYFNHPNFIPVELTEESKDNRRAIDGEPIIEFKSISDKANAIYLIFQFNNQFYLIPNATMPKISRLIKLNNDSRIFEMNAVSDRFELKFPAHLELIKENHWKLTSKGSFGDK